MHGCGRVDGCVCVCLCAWVCVRIFHSFIDGGASCLLSHHLWCSIPYWRIVGNPHQAIECHHCAIHMCPHIHHSVGFVGLSNTLRRLLKLDDAVKASRAALDVNFDEVGMWCVLVCISAASVDAYMVHVTRHFTESNEFRANFCLDSVRIL